MFRFGWWCEWLRMPGWRGDNIHWLDCPLPDHQRDNLALSNPVSALTFGFSRIGRNRAQVHKGTTFTAVHWLDCPLPVPAEGQPNPLKTSASFHFFGCPLVVLDISHSQWMMFNTTMTLAWLPISRAEGRSSSLKTSARVSVLVTL